MSLKPQRVKSVPRQTARVAQAALPATNLYLIWRDELGIVFRDEDFAHLYAQEGQPAPCPWRLALVTVMQFVENLSDRQAADDSSLPNFLLRFNSGFIPLSLLKQ